MVDLVDGVGVAVAGAARPEVDALPALGGFGRWEKYRDFGRGIRHLVGKG